MKPKLFAAIGILIVSLSCSTGKDPAAHQLEPRNSPVQIGEIAPDFTLEDQNGQKVTLSSARGSAPVVLVFYRGHW